ncbi:MAG: MFS transporter [Eubacteriaceae bacterium]|nr:MFS transporter [Eubacteriaceae bacterium]
MANEQNPGNSAFPSGKWKKQTAFFLASQNISLIGSSVVGFAITWHITLETGSGFWMMLATVCNLVPQVAFSLIAGAWADRYNRKHVIMLSDGFVGLAMLLLAISFLAGFPKIELLLVALAARAIGASIQAPAVNAFFTQLAPKEQLAKVQGINQAIGSAFALATPALGGLLLASVGIVGAFLTDTVGAAIAIGVASRIHVGKPHIANHPQPVFKDIAMGISYIGGNRRLKRLFACLLCSFWLVTPSFTLTPLMIGRTFGNEVWRLAVHEIVWSSAMVACGVLLSIRGGFRDNEKAIARSIAGFGISFALAGLSWSFASFLVFLGVAGLFWPIWSMAQTVLVQEITQPAMLGRVFSVVHLIITGTVPIAILIYGPLADTIGIEAILVATAFCLQ